MNRFIQIYEVLREEFGHRGWWPAETPFEVMVGAVLTQNTSWTNVEKALSNLRREGCLTPAKIAGLPEEVLGELIRPSGYWRQKAARLRRVAFWAHGECGDDVKLEALKAFDRLELREELLGLRGIGPETADSILLYALDKQVFVVDAYTARVLVRHGMVWPESGYNEIQAECEANLPPDVGLFNDFHAQMVEVGKRFCKKKRPCCELCPVSDVLGMPDEELV